MTDQEVEARAALYAPGARVAVIAADYKSFLGYGVYEGDFFHRLIAEEWANAADLWHPKSITVEEKAETIRQILKGEHPFIGKNPRIRLDNGDTVWGCECWWGPESEFVSTGQQRKFGAPLPPTSDALIAKLAEGGAE